MCHFFYFSLPLVVLALVVSFDSSHQFDSLFGFDSFNLFVLLLLLLLLVIYDGVDTYNETTIVDWYVDNDDDDVELCQSIC